jgi:hypothetical protein
MRIGGLLICVGLLLCSCRKGPDQPPRKFRAAVTSPAPAVAPPPVEDFVDDPEPAVPQTTETVTIKLTAPVGAAARISWGRKDLGLAPLTLTRPRGSGPLDLLVVAPGYLPLHTRVFTDRDETLALRLFREKEAANLPGFPRSQPPSGARSATP